MSMSPTAALLSRRTAIRFGGGSLVGMLASHAASDVAAGESPHLEANKALVRRVFDQVINGGQAEMLAELYVPGFVDHDTWSLQTPRPAGLPMMLEAFRTLFPAVQATIDAAVAEGNIVAAHVTWRDRHPPAGTHVVGHTMHLFHIAGNQIADERNVGWQWLEPITGRHEPGLGNPLIGG
jgi:predicted SnoaL-like aldol condensation-catalyzing enzyme